MILFKSGSMTSAVGVRSWSGLHYLNVYGKKPFTSSHAVNYCNMQPMYALYNSRLLNFPVVSLRLLIVT